MIVALSIIFVVSYAAIALEHPLRVNKSAIALIGAGLMWVIFALMSGLTPHDVAHDKLGHTLIEVGQIVFFLMGAMTIVELIDIHNGFDIITNRIKTKKLSTLIFQIGVATFFLSAVLDNLATTIVMCSLLKKILGNKQDRLLFAGLIVITANAGGAWSPIGDITTTMLWIGEKVSIVALVKYLIIPSLVCMIIPTYVASKYNVFKGEISPPKNNEMENPYGFKILIIGLSSIVFVPIFKIFTGLPPYFGMMLSLAVVATIAEFFNYSLIKNPKIQASNHSPVHHALTKIEMPSILFFLGILMAVGALEALGIVFGVGQWLVSTFENVDWILFEGLDIVVFVLGFLSAAIDNVPLVAASMGMFGEAIDNPLWHGIAYAAGTGGSMVIIGSAAGVVAMGMEKIDFMWYIKKIAFLAFIGYLAGFITFILLRDYVL